MDIQNVRDFSIQDLAQLLVDVKNKLDSMKADQKEVQADYDTLRKVVIPDKMEALDIETITLSGVGRLSLRAEMYVGIKAGLKEPAHAWLHENGHGALIQASINAQTLKAFVKEQISLGEPIPDSLFNVSPFQMATLTKSA